MQSLQVLSTKRLVVGESPLWDDKNQILYTVDVRGKTIQKRKWVTGETIELQMPQMVGSIALMEDGALMASLEDGIYRVSETGELMCLHQKAEIKGDQFNDGKVGPDGAFYVGTMAADFGGAFYKLTPKGELLELFDGVGCSNGLAWSRDEKTMYYCDSCIGKVEAFDFDKVAGSLSGRRTICEIPDGIGEFDGMTIDQRDHLWVGVWGGACLYEVDPSKGIVGKVGLPVLHGTCCTFAGPEQKTLVITSAAKGRDVTEEPMTGYTFQMDMNVSGRPTFRFGRACP